MVREHHCWAGGQWCGKNTAGQVGDAITLLLGGWAVVQENRGGWAVVREHYSWAGGRRCEKTTTGRVDDGARTPRQGVQATV